MRTHKVVSLISIELSLYTEAVMNRIFNHLLKSPKHLLLVKLNINSSLVVKHELHISCDDKGQNNARNANSATQYRRYMQRIIRKPPLDFTF
jgi:hypothetical protein